MPIPVCGYRSKLINYPIVHTIKVAFVFNQFIAMLYRHLSSIFLIVSGAFHIHDLYNTDTLLRPFGVRIRDVQL